MAERKKLLHIKSNQLVEGKAKLPTADQIDFGELAINYADGQEKISLKSSASNIRTISTDEQNDNKFATKERVAEIDEVTSKSFDTMNQSCGFNEEMTYVPQNELLQGTTSLSEAIEKVTEKTLSIEENSVGRIDPNSNGTREMFNDYYRNVATGNYSHAEGYMTTASGDYSHAEGYMTTASGNYSHAEGRSTSALNNSSHVEGGYTTANGNYSHAEGQYSRADGSTSHAEGYTTKANGGFSHAEGYNAKALGVYSHSANKDTVADNYAQTSIGTYNEEDSSSIAGSYNATKPAFVIGNGSSSSRGNAFKVLFNGQTFADGEYSSAGADYAEFFEWKDGNVNNEDRVGRFVTFDGDRIRLATATDTYILGIISAAPAIIGDNPMRWWGKYLNDEWGRPVYEDVEVKWIEKELQEDGTEIDVEKSRIDHVRKLNPAYNVKEKYIPRTERHEWDSVGMMGKLLIKQDGTLVAGSFCKSGADGIATNSDNGYYVMKVINEKQALILFR